MGVNQDWALIRKWGVKQVIYGIRKTKRSSTECNRNSLGKVRKESNQRKSLGHFSITNSLERKINFLNTFVRLAKLSSKTLLITTRADVLGESPVGHGDICHVGLFLRHLPQLFVNMTSPPGLRQNEGEEAEKGQKGQQTLLKGKKDAKKKKTEREEEICTLTTSNNQRARLPIHWETS